jgi:hypothetical protein
VARTGLAPARSPQVAPIGLAVSRDQETAGQSTNFGYLALAIFSVGVSWHVPPDTTETGVLTKPASRCRVEPFLDPGAAARGGAAPASASPLSLRRPARRTPGPRHKTCQISADHLAPTVAGCWPCCPGPSLVPVRSSPTSRCALSSAVDYSRGLIDPGSLPTREPAVLR